MKTALRLVLVGLFIVAVVGSESLGANFRVPLADGWYTWQVDAVNGSELELFALMEDRQPVKLRARGETICFTGLSGEVTDLGRVTADQSMVVAVEAVGRGPS